MQASERYDKSTSVGTQTDENTCVCVCVQCIMCAPYRPTYFNAFFFNARCYAYYNMIVGFAALPLNKARFIVLYDRRQIHNTYPHIKKILHKRIVYRIPTYQITIMLLLSESPVRKQGNDTIHISIICNHLQVLKVLSYQKA